MSGPRTSHLPRPLSGIPGRCKGQHRHARPPHDLRLAHPRRLRQPVRGDRRQRGCARPARSSCRQDQLRRVRDGLVDRAQRVRPDEEPGRPDARPRRLVRRFGGRRRRRHRPHRARLRDRRFGPPAGFVLRSRRRQADVRPREPLRARRVRFVARPHRRLRARRSTTPRSDSA